MICPVQHKCQRARLRGNAMPPWPWNGRGDRDFDRDHAHVVVLCAVHRPGTLRTLQRPCLRCTARARSCALTPISLLFCKCKAQRVRRLNGPMQSDSVSFGPEVYIPPFRQQKMDRALANRPPARSLLFGASQSRRGRSNDGSETPRSARTAGWASAGRTGASHTIPVNMLQPPGAPFLLISYAARRGTVQVGQERCGAVKRSALAEPCC